ncbi:hypothetical protein HU200_006995 [Digitaria exilis]|uniref:Peroxidase n=1 Tax=Digitaria exilis TaxID=1010633 RepID=A0A835KRK1_9POAL|nr:hypothetical protein HU200_006995 [Digitaria exilis]
MGCGEVGELEPPTPWICPIVLSPLPPAVAQLEVGYYSKTCPNAEAIVRNEMKKSSPPRPASPVHSSGSISTTASSEVKAKLEAACPNTVSCADVLAIMARDAVVLAKGPTWPVPLGRRDGKVCPRPSQTSRCSPRSSPPTASTSRTSPSSSGAHTLGTAHCPSYASRLYDFSGAHSADPSLDSEYADRLRTRCKSVGDTATLSEMDPGSYRTFDTSYYRNVAKRRGLFQSDAALLTDVNTREYVQRIATGKFDDVFFKDFGESMVKMGNVGVITGAEGEIRKKCYIPAKMHERAAAAALIGLPPAPVQDDLVSSGRPGIPDCPGRPGCPNKPAAHAAS